MDRISQLYETELNLSSGADCRIVSVPTRSFVKPEFLYRGPDFVAEALEIKLVETVKLDSLQSVVSMILAAGTIEQVQSDESERSVLITQHHVQLAAYICTNPVIPVENSPLTAASLRELIVNAGGAGVGAYIGFVVGASTPLLFITVPAGMIICGAAAGVAHGLEEGLRHRIKSLVGAD